MHIRAYVKNNNPNTFLQRKIRGKFSMAVKRWQAMPEDERSKYKIIAKKLNMSGYNLFIFQFMKKADIPEEVIRSYCGKRRFFRSFPQ